MQQATARVAARIRATGSLLMSGKALAGTAPTLQQTESGLALVDGDMVLRGDFARMAHRLKSDKVHKELLVKAAKIKGFEGVPYAVDATAGLGEDSMLLAAAGFRVTMFESDPVIAALLKDALERAKEDPIIHPAAARMEAFEADSKAALRNLEQQPDVVYLDPMFPAKTKSSATKKKFQLLHQLEPPCEDQEDLLQAALDAKPRKVIIKRPIKAPHLANAKPSYSLTGKTIRYDCIAIPR